MLIQVFAWPTAARRIFSETLARGGVEREDNVKILRFVRREGNDFAAGQKRKFFEQTFFVPDFHFFAQFLEREAHRNLTAERVAIGANMTEHDKAFVLTQDGGDFREGRVRYVSEAGLLRW